MSPSWREAKEMLPRSKYRPRQGRLCRISNPAILYCWIAGFFHSTGFCISHLFPARKTSKQHECASVFRQSRFFICKAKYKPASVQKVKLNRLACICTCTLPLTASDSDFAAYQKSNQNRRIYHEKNQSAGILPVL